MLRIQNLYTFAATRKGCCKAENIPVEPDAGNAAVGSLTALFSSPTSIPLLSHSH